MDLQSKVRIVLDLDGVSFNSVPVYDQVAQDLAFKHSWENFDPLVYGFNLKHEHFIQVQDHILEQGMMEHFEVFPDTLAFACEADEKGYEIDYVTARNHYTLSQRMMRKLLAQSHSSLLRHRFPQRQNFFMAYPKLEICQERGATIIIEDSRENCLHMMDQPNCHGLLMRAYLVNRSYNLQETYPLRIDSPLELWEVEQHLKAG